VPRLQAEDVFHDDYVHDDTQHPEEAVKINIRESNNKLRDAQEELAALKGDYEKVKVAKEAAEKEHEEHAAAVEAAKAMVQKYNHSMTSLEKFKDSLKTAKENLTAVQESLNKTDAAATAAAETVKQAQADLHDRIIQLVDAKDNVSNAEETVLTWEDMVDDAAHSNVTLAEWTRKYNESMALEKDSKVKLDQTSSMYNNVHEERKVLEARLDEAQKIFDIDREQYEEYVGPYPPPKPPSENLWWDALTDGKWHEDWPHSA
jgi:chromosome segregation ATPase